MDKVKVQKFLDAAKDAIRYAEEELNRPEGIPVDKLDEALAIGGEITLLEGARYERASGGYLMKMPTLLRGLGAVIAANGAPAIYMPPGTRGIYISDVFGYTTWDQSVFMIGKNDALQNTVESAPDDITLENIEIPTYRGKRGIEVNGRNVKIINPTIKDVVDPAGRDCQGIWIGNSPGNVTILNGYIEASVENILVGGDTMKIPNCRPTGIYMENLTVEKRLEWKGVVPVKNLIELKDGIAAYIRNCTLRNCWKSGQDGWAFVFTPRNGGAVDVTVENCNVSNVGGIVQIMGVNDVAGSITPQRTRVRFFGGDYRTDSAAMGGRGVFSLIVHGPELVELRGCYIRHTGNALIQTDSRVIDRLIIENCDFNYGTYGLFLGGQSHGANPNGVVKELTVRNNTIHGAASAFKTRFPENTYV